MVEWDYERKLDYLKTNDSVEIVPAELSVRPVDSRKELDVPTRLIGLRAYPQRGAFVCGGRGKFFKAGDVKEALEEKNIPSLWDILGHHPKIIFTADTKWGESLLWGFQFSPDSKMWISVYDPKITRIF
jgi:hypothetical protein